MSNQQPYNEVSTLEFDLSAYDAVMRTPHYDQVIGLRIIDLKGVGQFVLNNPKTKETEAGLVLFDDNETFQQKYDAGELTGPAGPQGPKGDKGDAGSSGSGGDRVILNGFLTIKEDSSYNRGFTVITNSIGSLPNGTIYANIDSGTEDLASSISITPTSGSTYLFYIFPKDGFIFDDSTDKRNARVSQLGTARSAGTWTLPSPGHFCLTISSAT